VEWRQGGGHKLYRGRNGKKSPSGDTGISHGGRFVTRGGRTLAWGADPSSLYAVWTPRLLERWQGGTGRCPLADGHCCSCCSTAQGFIERTLAPCSTARRDGWLSHLGISTLFPFSRERSFERFLTAERAMTSQGTTGVGAESESRFIATSHSRVQLTSVVVGIPFQ
jgi:hypothetical protein